MQSIEFIVAQAQLEEYLGKHLRNEMQNGALERRAQKLVDRWWAKQTLPVMMGTSGIRVTGCRLGFDIGTIKVKNWRTTFLTDSHKVMVFNKDVVALGYVNGFQLYMTLMNNKQTLVARSQFIVRRWSADEVLVPPMESPLYMALARAKALGYLSHLQGVEHES
jgi:hypothetical protein